MARVAVGLQDHVPVIGSLHVGLPVSSGYLNG